MHGRSCHITFAKALNRYVTEGLFVLLILFTVRRLKASHIEDNLSMDNFDDDGNLVELKIEHVQHANTTALRLWDIIKAVTFMICWWTVIC